MRDLSLISGRGQVGPTGDWKTLSGRDVRRMNLVRRLTTPLGSLWYDPQYGNDAYRILSQPVTATWLQQVEISCRRAAERESGLRVDRVEVQQDGRQVTIRVAVVWDGAVSETVQANL